MVATVCCLLLAVAACRDETLTDPGAVITDQGVVVTPSGASVAVGNTLQLSAELFDDDGNLVPGQTFIWLTPDPSIGTVDNNGMFTGVGVGTLSIAATTQERLGTALITVTAGGGGEGGGGEGGGGGGGGGGGNPSNPPGTDASVGPGPNEPSGMTVLSSIEGGLPLHNVRDGRTYYNGWSFSPGIDRNPVDSSLGHEVIEVFYPQGHVGGTSASQRGGFNLSQGYQQFYFSYRQKLDQQFEGHNSGQTKLVHPRFAPDQGNALFHLMADCIDLAPCRPLANWGAAYTCSPPLPRPDQAYWGRPGAFKRGVWQTIEIYVIMASGNCVSDGQLRIYVDGALEINASIVTGDSSTPSNGIWGVGLQPIWGGVADMVSQDMTIRFADFYVSAK